MRTLQVRSLSGGEESGVVRCSRPAERPKSTVMMACVLVIVLITTAFAGAGAAEPASEKVLVIAMPYDVAVMDPAKTATMYGPPGMIYETLIARDLTGAYVPGLAEWWNLNTTDPDHPTFEIRLQQGVKFHDNSSFNSDAVKRIINYYSDDNSWVQYEFWAIYGCQNKTGWPDAGIWCKDDYNLVFNLTWADVALQFNLSHLYGSMMGPDALESDGLMLYGTPGHKVVGTGPFKLEEWVPGDHVTLVKNEDYSWGASWYTNKGPAKIDKVIYRIISDETARFAAFESGAVDILQEVPPYKVATYQADPDQYTVITGPGQGTYHVEFNCQKEPWTSVDLRRAFGYSINRSAILETVWHGIGEEGVNYLPPIEPESWRVPAEYNYSYDVNKAMELFGAAGYADTDSDSWLENTTTSEELVLNLLTTNIGEDVAMAEILKTQFQAVGAHVTLTQYSETQLRDIAASGEQEAILFWYSWPRAEILDWHFGTWAMGGSNTAWYTDPVFDSYVTNWTYATTEEQFSDNATAGHIRLLTQGPWAPILFWHQIVAVHNWVTGWYVHPLGQEQVINIVDVDISKEEPVVPSLTLTSPLDGAILSEPTVIVTGVTDPNATLVVNGLLVAVEPDGSFQVSIALVNGTNEIWARATITETSTVSVLVTYVDPVPDLLRQISELTSQVMQLQSNLAAAYAELDAVSAELDSVRAEMDTVSAELDAVSTALSSMTAQVTQLNASLALTKEQLWLLQNETASLSDALDEARNDLDSAQSDLDSSNEKIGDLESMQSILLGMVALLVVLVAIMIVIVLRMKRAGVPPSS